MLGLINRFPELRGLPREEQKQWLERARYEVFVSQRRTGAGALYFLISLSVGFAIVLIGQVQFGFGQTLGFVTLFLGLAAAAVIFRILYGRLIRSGLKTCMQREQKEGRTSS